MDGQSALWAAVVASGVYSRTRDGVAARGRGRPDGGRGAAVARTLAPLAAGHLVSIVVVLLPSAAVTLLLDWSREIRMARASASAFAAFLLATPRHPRWMARIRPRQVALWSFSVALVHGAGLMLVPMLLDVCPPIRRRSFEAVDGGMVATAGIAFAVAVIHTAALVAAGGARLSCFACSGSGS